MYLKKYNIAYFPSFQHDKSRGIMDNCRSDMEKAMHSISCRTQLFSHLCTRGSYPPSHSFGEYGEFVLCIFILSAFSHAPF